MRCPHARACHSVLTELPGANDSNDYGSRLHPNNFSDYHSILRIDIRGKPGNLRV